MASLAEVEALEKQLAEENATREELAYALHGARSRRGSRREASSRSWTFSQRETGCSCGGSGGGTVMSPISTASWFSGIRARVAAQYLGASSR
jgi:hypothetical protein